MSGDSRLGLAAAEARAGATTPSGPGVISSAIANVTGNASLGTDSRLGIVPLAQVPTLTLGEWIAWFFH